MILPDSSFYLGLSPKRASGGAQGASSGPKSRTARNCLQVQRTGISREDRVVEFSTRSFSQQPPQVERFRVHRQSALGISRPRLSGTVPIQLHPVIIAVAEVQSFTHAMIAGAIE